MPSSISPAVDLVAFEEGFRNNVYLCPAGYPTIGFGRRVIILDYNTHEEITIPVTRKGEEENLRLRLNAIANWLEAKYPWFALLSPQRQAVLISLAYQVGNDGFTRFRAMIRALAKDNFEEAAREYLNSTAARQCPLRFGRGTAILRDNLSISEAIDL